MKRFCPKCGITIEKGPLCAECTPKSFDYKVPMVQVSEFNRTWAKKSWHQFEDLEQLIISRVLDSLKKKIPIHVEPFEFKYKKKVKVDVTCTAVIDGKKVSLPVKLAYRQCDMGEKEKSNYFEGIMQIRGPSERAFAFIDEELKKVSRKGIFVSKTVEMPRGGVDLYLTNKGFIKTLSQYLHTKFGAKISTHSQLFSHDHLTSKDIYRINTLVIFPNYDIKDVIYFVYEGSKRTKAKDEFILVRKIGKLLQGTDLVTGKTISLEIKNVKETEKLEQYKAKVISVQDGIEIIHPTTFQSEKVINSLSQDVEIDDEILIVLTKIGTFLVGVPEVNL